MERTLQSDDPLAPVFRRRLLLVTGKGGTGKTTVTAALACAAARRGLRVVAVEIAEDAAMPRLLAPSIRETSPSGGDGKDDSGDHRVPTPLEPGLFSIRIDPRESLTEYLELQIGVRAVVRAVTRNPGFQGLLGAAPGWRELITLGKIWHLETRRSEKGPLYDLIIVDAPATGHGLSFLSVPRVVLDTVRLGPLRRHTDLVQSLLTDPERTWVVPVTLLEELPVREALELIRGVERLGLRPGPVIANGIEPTPELAEDGGDVEGLLGALADLPADPRDGVSGRALVGCVRAAVRRAELQDGFRRELTSTLGARLLELPYLAAGAARRAGIEQLADSLEGGTSA